MRPADVPDPMSLRGRPTAAIERARRDIAEGRLWKARDRLTGALRSAPTDQEILGLLGEVWYRMGDLPRAGACWLLTEAEGPEVEAARAALVERYRGNDWQILRALPLRSRRGPLPPAVEARLADLGARAATLRSPSELGQPFEQPREGFELGLRAVAILGVVAAIGAVGTWFFGLFGVVRAAIEMRTGGLSAIPGAIATVVVVSYVALMFVAVLRIGQAASISRRRVSREWAIAIAAADPAGLGPAPAAPSANHALGWGLAGLLVPPLGGAAIWFGIETINLIRLSGQRMTGRTEARVGIVLGLIGLAEGAAIVALAVSLPAG